MYCDLWSQYIQVRKLFKGGNYSRAETIHGNTASEKLGRFGRQNILRPYLKIWDWDWIFGRTVKAISSLGVRSSWFHRFRIRENMWWTRYRTYLINTNSVNGSFLLGPFHTFPTLPYWWNWIQCLFWSFSQ